MVLQNKKRVSRDRSRQVYGAVAEKLTDPGRAWAAYQPDDQRPWNLALAGHLFRRAAFGVGWNQLQQALSDGPQRTVDELMRPKANTAAFNRVYDGYEGTAASSTGGLRAWWLRRMIQTPHPLLEKMTFFWHSHFATNSFKVKNPRLMLRYIQLLRSQALNSFRGLLQAISRDPAVLIYLGADANRKALPNDSFARPLMEVFTLGRGNYTEKDVREAARAFTGWFVLSGRLRYIPREHDGDVKQILGQKGNFTGDDVLRILLEQPATAQTVVSKLYRWLICETEEPDAMLIAPLVESFAKDYDILKLVETMLRSNLFFSSAAYRRRIKCPLEFALGIIKALEEVVSTTQLGQDLAGLGQNLYCPPTVKGWTGGRHWFNNATMVGRHNVALALLQGSGPYADKLNPWAVAQKHGCSTHESAIELMIDLFLQGDLDSEVYDTLLKTVEAPAGTVSDDPGRVLRRFVHMVVTLPEFQLA